MKSGSYSALVRSTSLSQKAKISTPRGNYTCLLNRGGVQYEPTRTAHSIGELGQRKNKKGILLTCRFLPFECIVQQRLCYTTPPGSRPMGDCFNQLWCCICPPPWTQKYEGLYTCPTCRNPLILKLRLFYRRHTLRIVQYSHG